MYMATVKTFKNKPSKQVIKSLWSTSQVEGFNSSLKQMWGCGTNMSPATADIKSLSDWTCVLAGVSVFWQVTWE